ncbi:hypothetical protein GCM10010211_35640 [Streptomyces albospinus]|uniref:Uncharacterized protein n=1 Tax=Streptomyces albospinus TaxID=285515 RepID=A0ABQ2V7E3_9ACTN|nr:hypothetical protein GCM10010211_35640 [Streptomyces albospinus]
MVPAGIPTVTITARFPAPDGRPLSGTATFHAPAQLTFPTTDVILTRAGYSVGHAEGGTRCRRGDHRPDSSRWGRQARQEAGRPVSIADGGAFTSTDGHTTGTQDGAKIIEFRPRSVRA